MDDWDCVPSRDVGIFLFFALPEWIWSLFNLILSGLVGTDSSFVRVTQLQLEADHSLPCSAEI
jgi:hypothetical protein